MRSTAGTERGRIVAVGEMDVSCKNHGLIKLCKATLQRGEEAMVGWKLLGRGAGGR